MKTDYSIINDKNYDYLFIIIALYDSRTNEEIFDILQKELLIINNNNNFKKVFIFDNNDYDYDENFKSNLCCFNICSLINNEGI